MDDIWFSGKISQPSSCQTSDYAHPPDISEWYLYLGGFLGVAILAAPIYLVPRIGTTSMKLSDGFTKLVPSILIFLFYAASFVGLTFALKGIDVSLAYAIWSGIGIVIIATIGFLYFKEPATALKIVSIGLIVVGVAGLKLSGVNH